MTSESRRKLILKSSDKETFEVDVAVASKSVTIKNMMEDIGGEDSVTLHNVKAKVLSKVIEYCKKHVDTPSDAKAERSKFDADFVNVDCDTLFDLALAANYLDIPSLLDVSCQAIADYIKDKQPEDVRKIFNIDNQRMSHVRPLQTILRVVNISPAEIIYN